ncbi:hypothetical protein CBF74_03890 [Lactobacillus taiwanensis]|nr:hypothetical protein CBF74_03890 [Lactobacillus taiwanensis]
MLSEGHRFSFLQAEYGRRAVSHTWGVGDAYKRPELDKLSLILTELLKLSLMLTELLKLSLMLI